MLLAVRMLLTVHFAILVVTHRNIPRDMLIGTLSPIQKTCVDFVGNTMDQTHWSLWVSFSLSGNTWFPHQICTFSVFISYIYFWELGPRLFITSRKHHLFCNDLLLLFPNPVDDVVILCQHHSSMTRHHQPNRFIFKWQNINQLEAPSGIGMDSAAYIYIL